MAPLERANQIPRKEELMIRNVLPCLVVSVLAACEGGGGADGRMSILLTDAPSGDVQSAVVTISEVYLQADDEMQGEEGRVVLRDTPVTTDLVTLANDVKPIVEDAVVPSGEYAQLRFVIDGAAIVVVDDVGATHLFATAGYASVPPGMPVEGVLRTPSFDTSGLKVALPEDDRIVEGDQHVLLADFDVAESFGHDTGGDAWVMHPVIHATDLSLTASLDVRMNLAPGVGPAQGFQARLRDSAGNFEGDLPLVDPDGDGVYEASFEFLDPAQGPYSVEILGPANVAFRIEPAPQTSIALESGRVATLSFQITMVASSR
jgi:uncharacterized protein DUF4382